MKISIITVAFFAVFQLFTNKVAIGFPVQVKYQSSTTDSLTGQPGTIAASFQAVDMNGKSLKLSDLHGKYVLLDFWASWCVPCRKSNPHLIVLYHQYKAKGFEIVGISDDDTRQQQWKNAVKVDSTGIWPQILRGAGNAGDLHRLYNIQSLPTKILIDPAGKIIGRFGDNDTTDDDLDKALIEIFK